MVGEALCSPNIEQIPCYLITMSLLSGYNKRAAVQEQLHLDLGASGQHYTGGYMIGGWAFCLNYQIAPCIPPPPPGQG